MTWPFENDTRQIEKKLARRSMQSGGNRNIFTVMTIALAAALLTSVFLWTFGVRRENINLVKDTAQIAYRGLSEQQGKELYRQEEIAWVGESIIGPSERIQDVAVSFSYGNAETLASQQMAFRGEIPQKEDEIMLSKAFLRVLGYGDESGQKISLVFENGSVREFVLTGIWSSDYEVKGTYLALVSRAYLNQLAGSVLPADYYVSLKNASEMSEEEAGEYAFSLAEKLNISDEQTIVRSDYFLPLEDTAMDDEIGFFVLTGILTLFGAGIVIYSIFYISIAGNIRSYGQLRTLGTTKKQVKRIVCREGKILAAIGIPAGLLTGNIIGYFLIPGGWDLLTAVVISAGTGVFTWLIVLISIHAPVRTAANASPVEAARYSAYQGSKKETGKLHRKITPVSLAKMNLSRSRAKSVLTILSLSVGGVMLVTLSAALISHDGEAETRGTGFPVGEFRVNLNANQSWDTADVSLFGLQKQNLFDDDLIARIEQIDGVEGIKRWYYSDAEYRVNGGSGSWIQGFSREEQRNLEENLLAGTVNYDELAAGNGIVLLEERMKKAYEIEAGLGDTVEVDFENTAGETVTKVYRVMGVVSDYSYAGFKKCFALPEQAMRRAAGADCTGSISVITDREKYQSIESALRRMLSGNSNFTLDTFEEKLSSINSMYQFIFGVMLIVAVVITCFSLINLVNTAVTNFLARKQEFGVLQSAGMTQRQLIGMLCWEGLIYSFSAALAAAVVGAGAGALAVGMMRNTNPYFCFRFPWQVLGGYLATVLMVQGILSGAAAGSLKKRPLAEQIRELA